MNVQLLRSGNAYPLFYDTLFSDLRIRCTEASNEARIAKKRVWQADVTLTGAKWTGNVDTLLPIFPKLWRRIDTYVNDDTFFDPKEPFANFKAWLEQSRNERVLDLTSMAFTGF